MSTAFTRRRWLAAGVAGAAAALAGCTVRVAQSEVDDDIRAPTDAPEMTPATGPNALYPADGFTVIDTEFVDERRNRIVPVRLHPPVGTQAGQPVPLVIFSHGLGGSRYGYAYLSTYLAQRGIASLHVQHVGSDNTLWRGNPVTLASRLTRATSDQEAADRVADLRFALDELLALPRHDRLHVAVEPTRIVVAGHSFGANTSLLACGAQVWRNGQPVDLRDPRFAAAILLSVPAFRGEADPDRVLRPVEVPTLHITTTGDDIRLPGYQSPAADRIALYRSTGSARKALAVFRGGSHSVFTDWQRSILSVQVRRATQTLAHGFLQALFARDERALRAWPEQHRDLVARFEQQVA